MTQTGIEPVTFRFVAQHLNHCATTVPELCSRPNNIKDNNDNGFCNRLLDFLDFDYNYSLLVVSTDPSQGICRRNK